MKETSFLKLIKPYRSSPGSAAPGPGNGKTRSRLKEMRKSAEAPHVFPSNFYFNSKRTVRYRGCCITDFMLTAFLTMIIFN